MKKALFVVAILGAMIASADDSYIYWMVGNDSVNYDYARVRLVDGSDNNYLSIYDSAFDLEYYSHDSTDPGTGVKGIEKTYVDAARGSGQGLYAALGSNPLAGEFVIELYNYENTFVGQSVASYNADSIYTANSLNVPGSLALVAPTSYAIPEPSSGLLMLVGCAMLGLRRRKVKTA